MTPSRGEHGVVRVEQVIGPGAGYARHAVPVDDLAGGHGYHADDVVVFLGHDDVLAVGREERVVRHQERLAGREVAGPRKLPSDPALRVDDQQPVVPVVGDEDVARQHGRIGVRREPAGTGRRREPRGRRVRYRVPGRDEPERRHRGNGTRAVLAAEQVTDASGHRGGRIADRHRQFARLGHAAGRRVEPVHRAASLARGRAARDVDLSGQHDSGRSLQRPRQVPHHRGRAGRRADALDRVGLAGGRLAAEDPDLTRGRGHSAVPHGHRQPRRHAEVPAISGGEHLGVQLSSVVAADQVGDGPGRHRADIRTGGGQLAGHRCRSLGERLDRGHAGPGPPAEQVRPGAEHGARGVVRRGRQPARGTGGAGYRVQPGHGVGRGPLRGQAACDEQPVRGGQYHLAGQGGRQLVGRWRHLEHHGGRRRVPGRRGRPGRLGVAGREHAEASSVPAAIAASAATAGPERTELTSLPRSSRRAPVCRNQAVLGRGSRNQRRRRGRRGRPGAGATVRSAG